MRRRPQLQIAEAVVETFPVAMMDLLVGQKGAPEKLGHDQAMLMRLVCVG
jgi:hypothetical protein